MKYKKIISLTLVIALLLPLFYTHATLSMASGTPYYDGGSFHTKESSWQDYKTAKSVPVEVPMKNSKGFFNKELWEEKQLVVYGDHTDIAPNDFKNATGHLDANGVNVTTPNKGYYSGGTGEYRYHGYDMVGNKYTNGNFPIDASSGTSAALKKWIHRIWEKTSPYYSNDRLEDPSLYNEMAVNIQGRYTIKSSNAIKNWINTGLPFQLEAGTTTNRDAYNHANVQTAPTTFMPGEVTMYHLRADLATKIWYQNFSLSPIKEKSIPPVEAQVKILSESDKEEGGTPYRVYRVEVKGTLKDEHLFDGIPDANGVPDEVLQSTEYHRNDISSWSMKLINDITLSEVTQIAEKRVENTGTATFEVKIPYTAFRDENHEIQFNGSATSIFNTGEKQTGYSEDNSMFAKPTPRIELKVPDIPPVEPVVVKIEAPKEMLDTERFAIKDETTGGSYERRVSLEGMALSDAQADDFLSGNYLFPLIGTDKIYTYSVVYEDLSKDFTYEYISYVVVYTTKPKAQLFVTGTLKENRKLTATKDTSINAPYLLSHATLTPITFDASLKSGNHDLIKYGTKNLDTLEFIVKGAETLNVQIQVRADVTPSKIQRSDIPLGYHISEVYTYENIIHPDFAPAMIANVWNSALTRNETLDFVHDASSVDLDLISVNTYAIYYDENGDGVPEKKLISGNFIDFTSFTPTKLGRYKIVFDAEESFGQPTLPQFITDDDIRKATIEREFVVENLAPMTKLYTDIEYAFPQADVIVLGDQSINRTLNNTIVSERVNWINGLRQASVDASVQYWDLHTYVYDQYVSTTSNTGESYPSDTLYYASGGYSGTLTRNHVSNNPGLKPVPIKVPKQDSKFVTGSSVPNTLEYYWVYKSGSWKSDGHGNNQNLPDTEYYNDGTYSGTLTKKGTLNGSTSTPSSGNEGDTCTTYQYWTATYSGTVTGTISVDDFRYDPYDNYTGHYSGTIYKSVKQTFTPTYRLNSNKYLVYFADNAVNNVSDVQAIKNRGATKVILVGKNATKTGLTHDYYINSEQALGEIMKQINQIIVSENPYENKQLVQVGETFNLMKIDIDAENDPIVQVGYQYIHNPNYYDNSMGAEAQTRTTFSDIDGHYISTVKTSFSKTGVYSIYRKIKDVPTTHPEYGLSSNLPMIDIYVHRKPIADFTLDWDYNTATNSYKTTWVDLSYDLDHQYTDAQKGIRDRRIMYRKTSGDNIWIYAIPDNLTHGTYEVTYMVMDIERAWSDPITKTFTLSAEPPIRLFGQLKTLDSRFETHALPASEGLRLHDLKTIYHRAHQLKITIHRENGQALSQEALLFSSNIPNYNIVGNNYNWMDKTLATLPTWQDGDYFVRVEAQSSQAPMVSAVIDLPFKILTPIWINGALNELMPGEMVKISAVTSKYASTARVRLMDGTAYTLEVPLRKTESQSNPEQIMWEGEVLLPEPIPDGMYGHRFIAETASGKQAFDYLEVKVESLKIESFELKGYWTHWRGQVDLFGKQLLNMPHRLLSYEKVIFTAHIKGHPDHVTLKLSPELEAMTFTNRLGQTYRYKDETGYEVAFPLQMVKQSEVGNLSIWQVEYVLPLSTETLSEENVRIRAPYFAEVTASKGEVKRSAIINDIDVTGNIFDHLYMQPAYK